MLDLETPRKLLPNGLNINEKLYRTLGYNLNDPRSPNLLFNRTPIQFIKRAEPSETSQPSVEFTEIIEDSINSFESALSLICEEFSQSLTSETSPETPCKLLETNFDEEIKTQEHDDPRSPSIGIERTPITLKQNEIENSPVNNEIYVQINEMFREVTEEIKQYTVKVQNNVEKNTIVYEDTQNVKYSTPKQETVVNNRTPLSCLGNNKGQSKIARAKPEIRKVFANTILKKGNNDENTPEMGKNISALHNSQPKSNKTLIPIARRGLAQRN